MRFPHLDIIGRTGFFLGLMGVMESTRGWMDCGMVCCCKAEKCLLFTVVDEGLDG